MKRFTLLIGLVLVFGFSTFAQTKRIAHRSHSANLSNYVAFEISDNLGAIEIRDLYIDTTLRSNLTYLPIDSINAIRIIDSLKKVQTIDSLKKLRSSKKLTDTLPVKQLKPLEKTDALKIQELKEKHKKQSFPLPLLLFIAIPTLAIVFATKYSK